MFSMFAVNIAILAQLSTTVNERRSDFSHNHMNNNGLCSNCAHASAYTTTSARN